MAVLALGGRSPCWIECVALDEPLTTWAVPLSGCEYDDVPQRRHERDDRGPRCTDEARGVGERIGPQPHCMRYACDHEARAERVDGVFRDTVHFEQGDQNEREGNPLGEIRMPPHGEQQAPIAAVANGD